MTPPNTPPSGGPAQQPPTNPGTTGLTTPQQHTPTRWERMKLLFDRNLEKFIKFFMILGIIGVIVCIAGVSKATWNMYHEDEPVTAAKVDGNIRKERDELIKQVRLQEIERIRLTNEIELLQKGFDQMTDVIMSNRLASVQSPKTNTPWVSKPTNHPVTQAEPPKNVGSGLVTVNENHGDIKIIIKNDDGERNSRTLKGPDNGQDITGGITKPLWTEPIKKTIPPKGNGVRYYIPKGWSVNYSYNCSERDFRAYINVGSREVPRWVAIDVSDDGISESIWIKNVSRRNIELTFVLTPAE